MVSGMGFEISGNFDGFEKKIYEEMSNRMHEAMAEGLAEKAREHGLSSADSIELDISSDSESAELQIDAERVRARANEILKED